MLPFAVAAAVGVVISPGALIATMLTLFGERQANWPFLFAGWLLGLGGVGAAVFAAASAIPAIADEGDSILAGLFTIGVGAFLFGLSVRYWVSRPRRGETPPQLGWMPEIAGLSALGSLRLAVLLSATNAKNFFLTANTGVAIAQDDLSLAGGVEVLGVYLAVASLCVLGPMPVYAAGGERTRRRLLGFKDWLVSRHHVILAFVFFVFGTMRTVQGIVTVAT